MAIEAPIEVLLLLGGKSRRMGQDKAQLEFRGKTLLENTIEAVEACQLPITLSIAHDDQRDYSHPTLRDAEGGQGPLAALAQAFTEKPETHWLVLACDLPLLDSSTLSHLLSEADPSVIVTSYASRHDGRPEPLCSLYSPAAAEPLRNALAEDRRCLRHFIESLTPQLLPLPSPLALDNANRPEHLTELLLLDTDGIVEKEVNITYYGKLSGEAPASPETLKTKAATLAGLYEEVRLRHSLSLDLDTVKAVLADEFVAWTTPLPNQSEVSFLPPFAGG